MGATFLAHLSDMNLIKRGLEQIQRDFAAAGFSFDNRLASSSIVPKPRSPRFAPVSGNGSINQAPAQFGTPG
jgi:hypothetical protein